MKSTNYDSLVFDLDGTLWDATHIVADGWNIGLKELGIERVVTAREIASVAGKPYEECIRALIPGLDAEKFKATLEIFTREERRAFSRMGGVLYPGVSEGIEKLAQDYRLFVVSNCQAWYMDAFFKSSRLRKSFEDYESHGNTGKSKSENIRDVITRNQAGNCVYIGDTSSDQLAAKQAGVDFIHVSYGFGVCEGLKSQESFADLMRFLG